MVLNSATATRVPALSRRRLLTGLAGLGLLAGCSAAPTPAPAPTAPRIRPYSGGYGPVELPLDPTRTISMYATDSDYALVLGLPLVGAYSTAPDAFPPYHADRLAGVQPVTSWPDPDYETLAALRPDLVMHTSGTYSPEHREPLTRIAPVFAFPEALSDGAGWREQLTEVAAAFDRADVATRFVDGYAQRAAALRERVQARWGGARIAYIGPYDPGQFYIAQANMQTNQTLHEDLGMPHAAVVPPTVAERRTDISYEEMGLLSEVDVLLLRVNPREGSTEPDREQTAAITGAPLWATLPAVRSGAAFQISGDLFYGSPLTAQANLDWAEQTLLA